MSAAQVRIDDPDDPRIAEYRNIRERDLVGRRGCFVAEGKVVLDVLLSSRRFLPRSLLVLDSRLEGLKETLALVPSDVPVHVASRSVMDAITGFPMHRGILAIGSRRPNQKPVNILGSLPERAIVLALVGISNHDNMGSIFRNAAALGADAVFLDPTCCDPLYRKAIRVSVGAALKVPFARFNDADALVAGLADGGFDLVALSPAGRSDVSRLHRSPRMAVLLGSEGPGLPQTLLQRLQTVRIGMEDGFDSLNVAAASAIALHRLRDAGA